ncbi:hypothetical protein EVG20_g393 [Dentipellis fragilis]|uniref:Uncharacterized protein n=1 Tax=Dentipellis fragilis TaxID=205917 RepID=A0A4Y9ZFG3_9AGAM|nr:hypothetical protein EVG20_g393 [Dentipellis fragilis]
MAPRRHQPRMVEVRRDGIPMKVPFEEVKQNQEAQLEDLLNKTISSDETLGAGLKPGWQLCADFDNLPLNVSGECGTAIQYLQRLRAEWRADKMIIPAGWQMDPETEAAHECRLDTLDAYRMDHWLPLLKGHICYASYDDLKERHDNPSYPGVDFLLSEEVDSELDDWENTSELQRKIISRSSLHAVSLILYYDGDEKVAESVIPAVLTSNSRCWTKCRPELRFAFYPPLEDSKPPGASIDFAYVVRTLEEPFGAPSYEELYAPVTIAHPALLVGAKGPARWTPASWLVENLAYSGQTAQPRTLGNVMEELSDAVHSSLTAHLLNTKFRNIETPLSESHSLQVLPQHLIIFGVVFDAEHLYIVAHFPRRSISQDRVDKYISVIVDKLPFSASFAGPTYIDDAVGRLRVAMALLVLRKHASQLAKLWEHQNGFWYRWIINVELLREWFFIQDLSQESVDEDNEVSEDGDDDGSDSGKGSDKDESSDSGEGSEDGEGGDSDEDSDEGKYSDGDEDD